MVYTLGDDHLALGPPSLTETIKEEGGERPKGSTALRAGFNIVNLFVGLGLLSKGYAVKEGGWCSLGASK